MYVQGCGNIEATARHVHVFSTLLSCSIYTFVHVLSIHVHTCTYMYSLVSVYQTFTRFIGQCPASLAVFSPMCTCIYMYMYLQCTCIHTCTVYMYMYVSPYSNSNYMYVHVHVHRVS